MKLRAIRELIIRAVAEPNTVYVGKGVYKWVNKSDKLVIRTDQRIVSCDSPLTVLYKAEILDTTYMEREWDETEQWYKPKGLIVSVDSNYSFDILQKDGWKQWNRWIKDNPGRIPMMNFLKQELQLPPMAELHALELWSLQIREFQKSRKNQEGIRNDN